MQLVNLTMVDVAVVPNLQGFKEEHFRASHPPGCLLEEECLEIDPFIQVVQCCGPRCLTSKGAQDKTFSA